MNGKVPQLIKYKFQTMFIKDKLQSNIKNFDDWVMIHKITTFFYIFQRVYFRI